MAEHPEPERTLAPSAWIQRVRTELTDAGTRARQSLGRLGATDRSVTADQPAPEGPSAGE